MSFANLFASSLQTLANIHGKDDGTLHSTLSFFGGIVLILLIDKLIPHYENPHEMHRVEEMSLKEERKTEIKPQLLRVDVVTALVLAIHNFPEGMVTFLAALKDINIAIPIACAIAIHNIPEGISVSVPIYYATGNRKRAFWLSFLSGLAEPVGAVIGYLILAPFLNDHVFGVIFGMIAGIMVFISLDELLPAAEAPSYYLWFGSRHGGYGTQPADVVLARLSNIKNISKKKKEYEHFSLLPLSRA